MKRMLSIILVLSGMMYAQDYTGSASCQTCHSDKYSDWVDSGHPYKFSVIENNQAPTYPDFVTNFQSTWMDSLGDGSLDWSNIAGVIGGFGWKSRFVGTDGHLIGTAGSTLPGAGGGHNQFNFFGGEAHGWVNYHPDDVKIYNYGCFKCHTTGGDTTGTWLTGVDGLGTFTEGGVGCEGCHGPGSDHIASPTTSNIDRVYEYAHLDNSIGGLDINGTIQTPSATGDDVNFLCGTCHNRSYTSPINSSGGFIKHHEQWDEFVASRHAELGFNCTTCHDPHKRVIWDGDAITTTCGTCHPTQVATINHNSSANCIDCHMPFAAKSGTTRGESGYKGDVRSHLLAINVNTESMFTEDGSAIRDDDTRSASLSPAYSCLGCHNDDPNDVITDKTIEEASASAAFMHGTPVTGVLTAVNVSSAPTIDGVVDDVWSNATAFTIPLGETYDVYDPASVTNCAGCHTFDSEVNVTVKAVYTENRISFLTQWPDPTASFTRGNSWYWDENITENNKWNRNHHTEQSEDRMSFFFPIGNITGDPYSTGGCMSKCHMYYPTDLDPHVSTHGIVDDAWLASGRGDMWHSKAARGGAYLSAVGENLTIDPATFEVTGGTFSMTGYADDKYVDEWAEDAVNGEDGGRYGDSGTSAYSHNRISDKSRPKWIETAPTDYADAMILKQGEIDGGECAGNAETGVSDADAATYWPAYIALNAVVPERILRQPDGSRGDIEFGAVWSDGVWIAEFGRDMNTDNEDDVQFDIGQDYLFNVAAFENSRHGFEHRTSQTHTLTFSPGAATDPDFNLPKSYSLAQNYPNPFNPTTVIPLNIPTSGNIKVVLYNLLGQEITVLADQYMTPGEYKIILDANSFAAGVYIYEMTVNNGEKGIVFKDSKKMVLMK